MMSLRSFRLKQDYKHLNDWLFFQNWGKNDNKKTEHDSTNEKGPLDTEKHK